MLKYFLANDAASLISHRAHLHLTSFSSAASVIPSVTRRSEEAPRSKRRRDRPPRSRGKPIRAQCSHGNQTAKHPRRAPMIRAKTRFRGIREVRQGFRASAAEIHNAAVVAFSSGGSMLRTNKSKRRKSKAPQSRDRRRRSGTPNRKQKRKGAGRFNWGSIDKHAILHREEFLPIEA